jgi:anaerobic magnesium-protoporphyrin IX monomethyl ester cyclase
MSRVLFINAADPLLKAENHMRPLWPAYLAAYTEKHLGTGQLEFRYMTGRIEEELTSFKPDIVAISSITPNYKYARVYAEAVKKYNLPIIIGGMHVSALPNCLTNDMDIGCIGEGEQTFFELIQLYIEKSDFIKEDLNKINGIIYRDEDGQLVRTPNREVIISLDDVPHPKRSLIGYSHREYLYTTRGCPYKCVFAHAPNIGGKFAILHRNMFCKKYVS